MLLYRKLGKSGLKVTEVGIGCRAIGGPSFAIPGFKNVTQVESNYQTMGQGISKNDFDYIKDCIKIFKQV